MKFVINNIRNIVWNLSSFDNLLISVTKKKIITAFAETYMFYVFDDVIDDFVKKKRQDLITLLQYKIWHLILYHKLTYTSSDFSEVSKILTAEELSEYFERSLYTINLALFCFSDHSDFSDICWEARSECKDTWRLTVYHILSCSSLKDSCSSWWSWHVCAVTLFCQLT